MSAKMNPVKEQVLGLLKYLADTQKLLSISNDKLKLMVGAIVDKQIGKILNEEFFDLHKTQEASKASLETLTTEGIISRIGESDTYCINTEAIPAGIAALSEKEVLHALTSAITYEEAKICDRTTPDKDVMLVFWKSWELFCKEMIPLLETQLLALGEDRSNELGSAITSLLENCRGDTDLAPKRIAALSAR